MTKTETSQPATSPPFFLGPVKPGPCKVPAGALRFRAGTCEFGEAADDSRNVPVKITARSGKPVDHWFWGKVVHDLAGMKLHKKALPVDYLHSHDEVLGYLDRFETGSGDLVVSGELVPFREDDRASEVTHKAQHGVPYEASIFFSGPLKIEELSEGTSAKVNGYELEGPALIFRQWNLRGVAICPYGADRSTKTQLTAGDELPVTILNEEKAPMAEKPESQTTDPDAKQLQDGAPPAGDAGKQTPPPLPNKQAAGQTAAALAETGEADVDGKQANAGDPRAECKRFLDAFGPQGAPWFVEGKPFAEAQQLHAAALAKENEDLKKKLAAADRGEAGPVSFQAEEQAAGEVPTQLGRTLGKRLGAFAASIKLPTAR